MSAKAGVIASDKLTLKPIPINAVKMNDGFWKPKMDRNHEIGIPALLKHLEDHGVVDNFMLVSGRKQCDRLGPYFSDSDLFKWMEGAAWDLISYPDSEAKANLDRIIDEVAAAQRPDGYLNTFFQGEIANERFRNLPREHELYNAGHLFQAAVAHYRATGEDKLLNVACRYADFMVREFGPGKIEQTDGHPEVELALVELYRATGNKSYLDLAGYFLTLLRPQYAPTLAGHAVRAMYTLCGEADFFAETGEATSKEIIDRQWLDLVGTKMHITGGVGARYAAEAVGEPYELPNRRAYTETCAAIGSAMFSYRMLGYYGNSKFADEIERALYNGVISGISLDGKAYFYRNPLACFSSYQRQEWFGCTCCPTNAVRTLATIPGYMYSTNADGVWINLYDNSEVEYQLEDGTPFKLEVKTNYPWDGDVEITVDVDSPKEFTIFVRKPGWCSDFSVYPKYEADDPNLTGFSDGYMSFRRQWKSGDKLRLKMEMPVVAQDCDYRVTENRGSVAITRGPIVFCAESNDNPEVSMIDLELASTEFESEFDSDLLNGVVKLKGTGSTPVNPSADRGGLYMPLGSRLPIEFEDIPITLIPYYAWANRGDSGMTVWIPMKK